MNGRPKKLKPRSFFQLMAGALVLSVMSLSACSDDSNKGGQDIIANHDSGFPDTKTDADAATDASDTGREDGEDEDAQLEDADDGDADADQGDITESDADPDVDPVPECPQTPCQGDTVCVDGRCLEDTPANKCAGAEDLGTLSPGAPITLDDTTAGATDILSNACSGGQGNELVYKFTVSEKSRVSFVGTWPAQFSASLGFRFDGCETPGESLCFDSNSDVSVEAGETVYLVIEQYVGRGNDFSLELSATPESCAPGDTVCSGDTLEVCGGGGNTLSYACADSCAAAGDQCNGGLCANAIAVSASASFSGNLGAYPSNFNFESNTDCTIGGTPVPTPGAEVIFKLESLNAGQVVSIAAGSNRAMFFMTDCQATPTCEAVMTGSGNTGTTEWTVPAGFVDQNFYLVIDRRNLSGGDFTYEIDISSP